MYNVNFSPQIEIFRRGLWGDGYVDTRTAALEASRRYDLPADVDVLPCYENEHGEWVPAPDPGELEKEVS